MGEKMKLFVILFVDKVYVKTQTYLWPIFPAVHYMYFCRWSSFTVFDLYHETILKQGQRHKNDA